MADKPVSILVRKMRSPSRKLTIEVDSDKLDKVRKTLPEINYTYIVEQILDQIYSKGLDRNSILKMRFVRPEDLKK